MCDGAATAASSQPAAQTAEAVGSSEPSLADQLLHDMPDPDADLALLEVSAAASIVESKAGGRLTAHKVKHAGPDSSMTELRDTKTGAIAEYCLISGWELRSDFPKGQPWGTSQEAVRAAVERRRDEFEQAAKELTAKMRRISPLLQAAVDEAEAYGQRLVEVGPAAIAVAGACAQADEMRRLHGCTIAEAAMFNHLATFLEDLMQKAELRLASTEQRIQAHFTKGRGSQ